MAKRLDKGQIAEIKDLYDGSYGSVRELAKIFKVNLNVIRRHTNHKGYRDWFKWWIRKKMKEPRYKEIQKRANKRYLATPEGRRKYNEIMKNYMKKKYWENPEEYRKKQREYYKSRKLKRSR